MLSGWCALGLILCIPTVALAQSPGDWSYVQPSSAFHFEVERMGNGPIIHPALPTHSGGTGGYGTNINGPSLIRVPDWVQDPLGKYYLYFAHHSGGFIRMAYADDLLGPWTFKATNLSLSNTFGVEHIASPDVHIDHDEQRIRMYYHQPAAADSGFTGQVTWAALSGDGLNFQPQEEVLGRFYFRGFEHDGWHYALARHNNTSSIIYRSQDGLTNFESGPLILPNIRHTALWKHEDNLYVFFSRVGDAPEHIMVSRVENLYDDWNDWTFTEPQSVLLPEFDFEGVNEPIEPSVNGAANSAVHQLRDPAIFEEDGRLYLLYSVAGERGIAIAEMAFVPEPEAHVLLMIAFVGILICLKRSPIRVWRKCTAGNSGSGQLR
jgi:hypothetical protein